MALNGKRVIGGLIFFAGGLLCVPYVLILCVVMLVEKVVSHISAAKPEKPTIPVSKGKHIFYAFKKLCTKCLCYYFLKRNHNLNIVFN